MNDYGIFIIFSLMTWLLNMERDWELKLKLNTIVAK
jgi:hypothetical protein